MLNTLGQADCSVCIIVVQSLSRVGLTVSPWTVALRASLAFNHLSEHNKYDFI